MSDTILSYRVANEDAEFAIFDYDFAPLSPPDFESLTGDLLHAAQNLSLERFGPGKDKGIDLRCAVAGLTVVQCKHYLRSGSSALKSALRKEAEKWSGVHSVERYVLVTSVSMSPDLKKGIVDILSKVLPVTVGDIIGREDLNAMLGRHPEVERRHFKLWINSTAVLDRFVNNDVWSRTEHLLESIDARAKFFVQTEKYEEALDTLDEKKACIISGPPGVGKILLAEMLILTHSREGFQTVPISADISEGFRMWDPAERQLFYYDDFLGQTNLAESLGKNEDDRLANFIAKVENAENKRFILTTRDQILRVASTSSDRVRRTTSIAGRTVVSLDDYSFYARGRILYNHIYFSALPLEERQKLLETEKYLEVIDHPNYSPRIIEQVLRRSSNSLVQMYADLDESLKRPHDLWMASFSDLSETAQRVLRILLTYPPGGGEETQIRSDYGDSLRTGRYDSALRVLDGTWIRIWTTYEHRQYLGFANPSCRDFIKDIVITSQILAEEAILDASTIERTALLFGYSDPERPPEGVAEPRTALSRVFARMGADFSRRLQDLYSIETSQPVPKTHVMVGANLYRMEHVDPRPDLLIQVLSMADSGDAAMVQWVEREVVNIINGYDAEYTSVSSVALLKLAQSIVNDGSWSWEIVEQLVDFAIQQIDSWDELEYLAEHAVDLDVDLVNSDVQQVALQVLRFQLDYLRDGNDDIDEVSQGADNIVEMAYEYGLDWSEKVGVLHEKVQLMPEENGPVSGPRYRPPLEPEIGISDEEAVRHLFQGLADE